jgi:hypothetical protein
MVCDWRGGGSDCGPSDAIEIARLPQGENSGTPRGVAVLHRAHPIASGSLPTQNGTGWRTPRASQDKPLREERTNSRKD